jgi:hypothetical protein
MNSHYIQLIRQAIFHVLDEREWDFENDEHRVDFADQVITWIPAPEAKQHVTHTLQDTGSPRRQRSGADNGEIAASLIPSCDHEWVRRRDGRRCHKCEKVEIGVLPPTLAERLDEWSLNPNLDPLLIKELREAAAALSRKFIERCPDGQKCGCVTTACVGECQRFSAEAWKRFDPALGTVRPSK